MDILIWLLVAWLVFVPNKEHPGFDKRRSVALLLGLLFLMAQG